MGTTAEQRAWEHTVGNVTIIPSVKTGLNSGSFRELFPQAGDPIKLEEAIRTAPKMVQAACDALSQQLRLESHTAIPDTAPTAQEAGRDPDQTEAGLGLFKYFNLKHQQPEYWRFVRGILRVYQQIATGLSHPYEIVVANIPSGANARVKSHGAIVTTAVSPIRDTFEFPDEFGHTPFTWPERRGRIQIHHAYIVAAGTRSEDLARTLVHEASHKWARTKDILYKSQSLGKLAPELAADLGGLLEAYGAKPQPLQRPTRAQPKPLMPMAGIDEQGAIHPERWLENADSYAWLARRLWKRAGRG